MDALKVIDDYMHAMGHSIAAEDAATAAIGHLDSGSESEANYQMVHAMGQLSAAITGLINARVTELGGGVLDSPGE